MERAEGYARKEAKGEGVWAERRGTVQLPHYFFDFFPVDTSGSRSSSSAAIRRAWAKKSLAGR
jgi:hypothetical protein